MPSEFSVWRRLLAFACALAILLATFGLSLCLPDRRRASAWLARVGAQLTRLHEAALIYASDWDVHNFAGLVEMNYVSPPVFCLSDDCVLSEAFMRTVARAAREEQTSFTLEEIREPGFPLPRPLRVPSAYDDGWCCIGDFRFTPQFWSPPAGPGPSLVLAVSIECPFRPGVRIALTRDHGPIVVHGLGWIDSENTRRRTYSLAPLGAPG